MAKQNFLMNLMNQRGEGQNQMGQGMMSPAVLGMARSSPIQQEMPEQEESPLTRGSMAAMNSTREGLAMNEEQKRQAQGMAAINFFSNYAKSKAPNALGAINESFQPAMQAYMDQQAQAAKINAIALKDQREQEHEARLERRFGEKLKQQEELKKMITPYQEKKLALDEKKIAAKEAGGLGTSPVDHEFLKQLPSIQSKKLYDDMSITKKKHDENIDDINYIRKSIKTLNDLYKDEVIRPDNPILNEVAPQLLKMKNLSSWLQKPENKKRLAEKIRNYTQGKLKRLNVTLEGAIRGGKAAVPLQMIKMFESGNVYPQLIQGMDSAMYGLGELQKEELEKRDVAGASVKYGKVFTPSELRKWKELRKQEEQSLKDEKKFQNNLKVIEGFEEE